jgi:hypothetical protein
VSQRLQSRIRDAVDVLDALRQGVTNEYQFHASRKTFSSM